MGINLSLVGRVCAATAVIASTVLLGLPTAVSAAPEGEGSISGTVLDGKGGRLEGICVSVENVSGTKTDLNGDYSFANVPTGQHRLQFSDCRPNPTFLTQWYLGARDEAGANWVDVADQTNTALADVYMQPGVSVTGTVTDLGGNPVQDIRVRLDPQGPYNSNSAVTDMYGQYRTGPVENGHYRVSFSDDQNPSRYATEYWDDQYLKDDAQILDLQVSNGTTVSGIDAQLTAGATLSGHVQNKSGTGIEQVCVSAVTPGWNNSHVAGTQTDSSGDFTLSGLPPMTVIVSFSDCGSPRQYVDQYYNEVSDRDDAQHLSLSPGSNMSGINATLGTGATVSGTVTDNIGNPVPNTGISIDSTDGSTRAWGWTDATGKYTTSPLPPGDYRVQFRSNDLFYAAQYWSGQATWDSATILTIQNTSPVNSIDAQLAQGARITGNVTRPGGAPASNICVGATYGTDGKDNTVAWEQTDAAGNYALEQLPVGTHWVRFEDCANTGPYLDQWYNGSGSPDGAQPIDLTAGQTRSGINAQMQPAAQILGTVKNTGGTPLEGICVQATTDNFTGGMDHTDSDGKYSIKLATAGQYKVQFVDCGDFDDEPPVPGGEYLAQWWGGSLEPATARKVTVADGATVKSIDATLATAGGTGTVTGRISNVRGEPLKACVVLYLPDDSVRFGMADANGDYSFTGVPTGTWTLGFLGCGPDGPSPVIPDAGGTGVFFNAVWYDGAPLEINQQAPDPIAQGATLITIGPGEVFRADKRFGHEAVKVKPPIIGEDFILVDFDTIGLTTDDGKNSIKAADLTYHVGCDSKTGTSTSASQDSYPVKVSGFTPGAPYVCSARVLSNGVDVAGSTSFEVTVGKTTPAAPGGEPSDEPNGDPSDNPTTPTQPSNDSGDATGTTAQPVSYNTSGATPAKLAYTGGNIAAAVALAAFMILMGIGVIATSMRIDPDQGSARASHPNR